MSATTDTTHEFAGRGNVCERLLGAPSGQGIERDRCGQPRSAAIHRTGARAVDWYCLRCKRTFHALMHVCPYCKGSDTRLAVSTPTEPQPKERCAAHCGHDPALLNSDRECTFLLGTDGSGGFKFCSHRCAASDTPPAEATAAPAPPDRLYVRWLEDHGGHMNWCVVAGCEGDPGYISAAAHEKQVERLNRRFQTERDAAQRYSDEMFNAQAEVDRLREALRGVAGQAHGSHHLGSFEKCTKHACAAAREALGGQQ